jgi:hypothetical protein
MKHLKLFEDFRKLNEGYSESDKKKLLDFATTVAEEIKDEYGNSASYKNDDYSPEGMLEYILDWGKDNDMSAEEILDEFDWSSLTQELGLEK